MTDSDSEPTADHPLWLDWLATFIAAKGLPSDTLEKGRLPRHRAVRWVGHLSGGDYPFPTAREALRAVLREVGELWATDRIRAHLHVPGEKSQVLNVDPDDRRRARFSTTRNQLRLPRELADRGPIRIEEVTDATVRVLPGEAANQRVLNIRNCPGRRIPDGAIYIGRAVPRARIAGSKWGNPFKPTRQGDAEAHAVAVAQYRAWLCDQPDLVAALPELRGRDLVCWCAPLPCHGDVLLELANERPASADPA